MMHNINKKYRLVFLTVNSSFSHSSLALPLLHGNCGDLMQWEWLRYDMTIESDIMNAVRDIYRYNCDLLVTDLYLFNRQTALDVLQRYHALDPDCRIAVGGPECLGNGAENLLQEYPYFDCIFRGEGEEIFRQYLENFNESSCKRKILPAEENAVYENWVTSPYPVKDPFFVTNKPFVQIETSRGCPMQCFYCTSGGTKTRYRSLDQVREELQLLAAEGIKEVRVLDRTFNLPQERGAALLRMFREEFSQMRFHLELHPQFMNELLREELSKALPGQLHIEAGIQCLNNDVQRWAGRRSNTEQVLEGLAFLCRQTAFETHADLLAGLPGQKWEYILADTARLMELEIAEIQLEVLKVLPGTPLRKIAAEYGMAYSSIAPYDVMKSNTMTLDEIQYARDLSRLLDITYNHRCLHEAVLEMSRECPEFVSRLLDFFHWSGGSAKIVWDLKKRFLFLLDFCRIYNLKNALLQLAYQWLLAGFLPGQGPDEYAKKAHGVPPEAVLLCGSGECVGERETRYWSFAMSDKVYYLVYNRAYALNRPAAVYIGTMICQ